MTKNYNMTSSNKTNINFIYGKITICTITTAIKITSFLHSCKYVNELSINIKH